MCVTVVWVMILAVILVCVVSEKANVFFVLMVNLVVNLASFAEDELLSNSSS